MENDHNCKNDEARSMRICHARKGTLITVYDNGYLKTDDDWTTIEVKKDMGHACKTISTFEENLSSSLFSVNYKPDGNLDGKVSSFSISFGNCSM